MQLPPSRTSAPTIASVMIPVRPMGFMPGDQCNARTRRNARARPRIARPLRAPHSSESWRARQPRPIPDPVARVQHELGALGEAAQDLDLEPPAVADLDRPEPRPAVLDRVDGPPAAIAEQGARRDREHAVPAPDHDPRLDPEAVAELRRDLGEPDDHVHALLLDAERGDPRPGGRLDAPHLAREAGLAAPRLDRAGHARPDLRGVARQHVDDDLEG